jgi:Xaa-Pro dipeptidase
MRTNRRRFLQTATLAAASAAVACSRTDSRGTGTAPTAASPNLPDAIRALKAMTAGIVPISEDERRQRIAKAQRLMAEHRMDAIFMEGTTSCYYYTGMRWFQSERTFGVVIPASGALAYVCAAFEEETARGLIKPAFGDEVRVWQEDDSPYALIAGIVKDRGIKHHRIGVEERVRFFVAEGIRKAAPGMDIVEATPVTAGCRMFKSNAEIALMQRANDVTIAAYRAGLATLREGMTREELERNLSSAFAALGFTGSATVQFGKWTALPHGSSAPQTLREGDVVMIDDGAECEGYLSDITRTVVLGKPTARQTDVWNKELAVQTAAFNAIKIGVTCDAVDAATRAAIEKAGFGPGYKLPGLPYRTGHGIGLDEHEWANIVKGNTTPIQPGLCFTDEPMISIPGEFGIRLEDDVYIGEDGPHFFSRQSVSIDQPFG